MKLKNTKLREGDEVIVISGREKGKRGNIKKIVGDKCVVNDLNLAKKCCNKEQKVLKVPNTDVFRITAPFLLARGISRIVCAEKLIAL